LSHGKPRARDGEASRRLASAIARCLSVSVEPGDPGTGIVLGGCEEGTAVAHILPLAPGQRRTRHAETAVAAVFVQTSTAKVQPDLAPVAEAYGLTPAETDLLARLVAGDDITGAGEALGIAKTTAKTHLARLFAKTGTNRQSMLVAQVNKLVTAPIVSA
jgi:DNA-binding CsgD family transcriptional regulator